MGSGQSKEISRSPLGCVLAHWKDITGTGGTENKKTLIKYCSQWWPLYQLGHEAKWPRNGTTDYSTLVQLMLFLRREGKWDEVSYADMFFTLWNHPEWQRDCGIVPPQGPLVLAPEKGNNKGPKSRLKRCFSACSTGQRCTKPDTIHQAPEHELTDLFKPPPQGQEEDAGSEGTDAPPGSPVCSRTRTKSVLEAVGPDGDTVLVKVPLSTTDLAAWKEVARDYRNDPVSVAKHFRFIVKQHSPDWSDIQLLLEAMTETEKQLILKVAGDLAEDQHKADVKEFFPLQDPNWNPKRSADKAKLQAYQGWIAEGMERAIPHTINWSALYAVRQGPSETPSAFLERLRDAMRRSTPLDPGSEVGTQQLVSLFLGQSTRDIRCKLQKLRPTEGRNLGILLDEAWRVFSSREEGYRRGQKRVVVAVKGKKESKPRQGPPRLGKDQCARCKKFGHWKNECPERKRGNHKGRAVAHVKEGLSPFEISCGRPYDMEGMSTRAGDGVMTSSTVTLCKQITEIERHVAGTQSRGLDGPVHNTEPGDYVYVKSLAEKALGPQWEGPFQVLLTSFTAVKIKEQNAWIHHTRVKKAHKSPWRATPVLFSSQS
ncbi:uncharacterized protein O3Q21_008183 isoform 1-T2 [Podargus strigoides]